MKKSKRILSLLLAALMLLGTVSSLPMTVSAAKPESAAADVVINPVDYGADPSGVKDSTDAIWKALEAAKAASEGGTKSVELRFPKGEYHIYKDYAQEREYHTSNTDSISHPKKRIGLLIEEQQNLTINGCGSLFMMHGNMMALAVVKSKNITLKDLSWDFAVPTVTEMTVLAMGQDENGRPYTDFYIPKCFPHRVENNHLIWSSELSPYTGMPYWTQTDNHSPSWSYVGYRPTEHMTRRIPFSQSPFSGVASMEELDSTTVRITYNGNRPHPEEVGFLMEFVASGVRETAGAFTWESENVVADHVNVHYMHGFGWLLQMSKDVYFYDCNLVPRENSGHVTVSFADGIHASGCAGEVVIQNCNFSQTHDDPINMHGTFTRVEKRVDDHTLILKYIHGQQGGFPQYHVGDKVRFFTRDTLESTDKETHYTVASATNPGEDGNDLKTMRVTFEETLPTNLTDRIGQEPKYVAENVTYAPKVTIKGCTFQNVATRCILCTSCQPVVIEDNIFYPSSMAAIFLSNDADEWYESGPIRDLTIRNNVFYGKDIGGREGWAYAPAIYIHPVTKGGHLPKASNPIHKNITIEGNTFVMDEDMVVKAESVENLTIRNNKILRMNPNIKLTLALEKQTMAVGESGKLQVQATGKTNNKAWDHVYDFTKCKDVTISGNTYDDGMKNYIVADRDSQATITNKDPIPVRNQKGEAASPAVGQLLYVSSDPQVVSVDETGTLWAGKPGTAEIFAYYPWNGTAVLSNQVTVTVDGAAQAGTLTIQGPEEVPVTQTGAFTVQDVQNVTWEIKDFLTGEASDLAEIDPNGTLHANGKGVIWVQASTDTASARVPVVLYETTSQIPTMEVIREDAGKYTLTADSLKLQMQSGDLYQDSNTLKNLFLYTPENGADLRTTVKVSGLPVRENGQWDTASFMLYEDDDNYVTIGKKSHYDGFAAVVEKNGTAVESGGSAEDNQTAEAWLGITRKDSTITLSAKVGDGAWKTVKTITDSKVTDNCKIGFGAWHSNERGKSVTFSDFRVGTADTDFDQLTPVPFVQNTANDRPVVTDVVMKNTGSLVTADPVITDQDGAGESLYLWTWQQNGQTITRVTKENNVDVKGAKSVTCQVFPVDTLGQPGTPSEEKTYTLESGADSGFAAVTVNGQTLEQAETTVLVPAGKKINLSWSAAGSVTLTKNGTAVDVDNFTELALDVQNGDTLVLTCGEDTRTIHVQTAASNDARLLSVTSDDLELTGTLPNGVHSNAATASVTIQAVPGATVQLLQGDYRVPVQMTNGTARLHFVNGLNTFYICVTAADGITVTEHTLNVIYTPSDAQEVTGIMLNGEALAGFAPDRYDYMVRLAEKPAKLEVQVHTSAGSQVSVMLNGTAQNGSSVSFQSLKDGKNELTVQAKAPDGITVVSYQIQLICPDESNAELQSVKVGDREILNQLTAETENEISWNENEAELEIHAQDLNTKVELLKNGTVIAAGQGTVRHTLPLVGERPVYTIRTTAVNGSDKTWTVAFTNTTYLSDLQWESASVGYGDHVRRDKNIDDQPIVLTNDAHQGQTFKKGLGTHAESVIVYDIAGKNYCGLHGFVGIDHSEHDAEYGDVQFVVLLDNKVVFDSKNMLKNTPMKELNLEIPADAKTLTLKALVGDSGNNWSDHADWAEMKLTGLPYSSEVMDKEALTKAIADANKVREGIAVSDKPAEEVTKDTKFVTTAVDKALTDAIAAANKTLAEAKTQDELDAAVAALNEAVKTYTDAIKTGTYVEPEKPDPEPPVDPDIPPYIPPVRPTEPTKPTKPEVKPELPFTDVKENDWFYDSVYSAWENNLLDGMTATEFAPNSTLTVAQTIKLAAALHERDKLGKVTLTNGAEQWYSTYVSYAIANDIIEKNYADRTPAQMNAPVSRREFVKILHGALDFYAAKNTVADNAIPDVQMADKNAAEIYEFYRAGILTGSDAQGTFLPETTIKRSEAATILVRMFDVTERQTITLQ